MTCARLHLPGDQVEVKVCRQHRCVMYIMHHLILHSSLMCAVQAMAPACSTAEVPAMAADHCMGPAAPQAALYEDKTRAPTP